MTSTAQIDANRLNCLSSTGPRSQAGLAASSRNATTHGLSAADPVLCYEDRAQFLALLESYKAEFAPATPHEDHLVFQMAGARWKLYRVERMENSLLDAIARASDYPDTYVVQALDAHDGIALARLDRYRANLERTYHRSVRELRAARELRPSRKIQNEANSEKSVPNANKTLASPAPTQPSPALQTARTPSPQRDPQPVPPPQPVPNPELNHNPAPLAPYHNSTPRSPGAPAQQ